MTQRMLLCFVAGLVCCRAVAQTPTGRIMFSKQMADKSSELYMVNSDGTNLQRLTKSNKQAGQSTMLNGKAVYVETEAGKEGYSLKTITLASGSQGTLMANETVCNPHAQPNGNLIAYEYYKDAAEIWVMEENGNNKRRLVANARHPYWYADGRQLLFTRNYEVYITDIKTGVERQLTHLRAKDQSAKWPAISPDGHTLAAVVYGGTQPLIKKGILVLDMKTNKQHIIADCDMPAWTSDNKYIVCSCTPAKSAQQQIAVVNIATGAKTWVTNNDSWNDMPVWVAGK